MSGLDLGLVGNCSFAALIDSRARVVWCCLPRFDGDPVFHALLGAPSNGGDGDGAFAFEIEDFARAEQSYVANTAVLTTRLWDSRGQGVEITDFAPRFRARGRTFRPLALVRRVRAISGRPRIRVRLRPRFAWGSAAPAITHGSNHVRYVHSGHVLRLTTNAPVAYVLAETAFLVDEAFDFYLGPDETPTDSIGKLAAEFEAETAAHWREWTRRLSLPFEWQEAVIRAAITLKLCTFEETGAIVAAMTTSIPEAPGSGRTWDYRYCWLRDAFFVVRALNSLSEVETMENYLRYLANLVAETDGDHLQPVFGIGRERNLTERLIDSLAGYRGEGPVRAGNQAHEHFQHDVYGNVVLGAAQAFFDCRLLRRPGQTDFERIERLGETAYRVHDQPDAGMWELRTRARVHTASSLMSWAACDRLGHIAGQLGLDERARLWRARAEEIRQTILARAWNERLGSFVESFGGEELDAGLLLMAEVGFLPPKDPRFVSTVERIGARLRRGDHLFRYAAADDFGAPETAFTICTFWYIDALARIGRADEARAIFETVLTCRNHLGLLSEDVDPATGELWGNFPQTYSMVGVINAANRLSRRWDQVV